MAAAGVFQVVEENQPHTGGDRTHLGYAEASGDFLASFLQSLSDKSPGEVRVHPILEVDIDDGESEIRNGTDLLGSREATQRGFDGVCDILFDLFGS